ncbi:hypothetical protein FLO80_00010 [Aquicoccus porphyridii]|uniref:Uncharacterized protein n=1 Tax=Aquicoccus porphyridii TaxID=1852029 RepID=A0A5A9ZTD2_9RHOB|nr:hypothetical protein FLO80_00010 [Aquicoccus porphyridii]
MLIVAIGLIAVTGLGQAQEQTEGTKGQASQQQGPTQALPLSIPVNIVEDQAAADARKRREEEARQREIADLAAQQGMNAATQSIDAATQDMRDYALYSTLLVALGTGLLFYTLWLTRQANRAAANGASAAQAANLVAEASLDHAKKAFNADYRPFVLFTTAYDKDFRKGEGDTFSFGESIKLSIQNFGRAPARDIRWGHYQKVIDVPNENEWEMYRRIDYGFVVPLHHILAPQQKFDFSIVLEASQDEIDQIMNGKMMFVQLIVCSSDGGKENLTDDMFLGIRWKGHSFSIKRISNGNVWTHQQWQQENDVKEAMRKAEAERLERLKNENAQGV